MLSCRRANSASPAAIKLCIIAIGVGLAFKLTILLWLKYLGSRAQLYHGYIGNGYPEIWPIEQRPVLGAFDNSNRYHLSSPEGVAEWSSLVPPDGGVIYLGEKGEPFTVSMIHQLHCLNIVRDHLVREDRVETAPLARHCLNYIRQVVMCRADIQLEPFRSSKHDKGPVDLTGIYQCRDWEAVYNEIEGNQKGGRSNVDGRSSQK